MSAFVPLAAFVAIVWGALFYAAGGPLVWRSEAPGEIALGSQTVNVECHYLTAWGVVSQTKKGYFRPSVDERLCTRWVWLPTF